jgi:hypothetical protein
MVDADRTTVASFYHIAPTLPWRLAMLMIRIPSKILEFESVTAAGAYQTTTNAPAGTQEPRPSEIRADYAPRSLSVADLYHRHRDNLNSLEGPLRRVNTAKELIALQVDLLAKVRAHLEAIGWVTREYLRSQGTRASEVDAVYAEARRLLAEGFRECDYSRDPGEG